MKCSRCEKEFQFEFLSVQQWLRQSKLDRRQLSFIIYNYGGPLCPDCESDVRNCFYLSGVNPYRNKRKTIKATV